MVNNIGRHNTMTSLEQLTEAIQDSWSSKTSSGGSKLPLDNLARGQCDVSSMVVQDYFGGDLVRVHADGDGIDENHYFNRLDNGTVIDTTRMQYKVRVTLADNLVDLSRTKFRTIRERCLDDVDTQRRYEILKNSVKKILG